MWTLKEAIAAAGGKRHGADVQFNAVVTDSRGDCEGKLFIALRGERFDGHDYIAQARAHGAVAAMVSQPVEPTSSLPLWQVDDTRSGLGRLAAAWRTRFAGKVVAITGSNGKTTCKEMLAAICRHCGRAHATVGNFNNIIGMPLTLLAARDEDFLILEMGANHPGEIAALTTLAQPEVAVITNAGRAHLEGFGSLEGVAHAKGEIASGLTPDGTFVFMDDTPWTELWRQRAEGRATLVFGLDLKNAEARVSATSIRTCWDQDGFQTRFDAWLPGAEDPVAIGLGLAGRHNVMNALAALAAATALDLPVAAMVAGLAELQPVPRRMQPCHTPDGMRLIDDTYNANPDSLAAAIAVLVEVPGRHLLVLGDFGELGQNSAEIHAEMGHQAKAAGVDGLLAMGSLAAQAAVAFGDQGWVCTSPEELLATLRAIWRADDLLLVKGSRLAAMDRIVDALQSGSNGQSAQIPSVRLI